MATIHIVGAGPGSADLLTVRAARLLARADAVLYDRLVSHEVLATIRPGAELHSVGKEAGRQEEIQREILDLLEDCGRRHQTVVRLKGGDPMVFGRGGEEWSWLVARGWDVEVTPGLSSAICVPELAGIPVTYRGVAGGFAVVTGHRRAIARQDWAAYAQVDTLVVLMGVGHKAEIAAGLIAAGRDGTTPVAFVENGSTPRERVVVTNLNEAGACQVESPAVMVVGAVVQLRAQLGQSPDFHTGVDLSRLLQVGEAHARQAC